MSRYDGPQSTGGYCSMQQRSCFFFAADQKFFPFACLAARRVLDVSAPVDGFILHTGMISAEDRVAGERLLDGRIGIIDVTKFMEATNFNRGTHPTLATYIRLFADQLPEFEPYDRIAYSDADVLFNRSIADLCNTPLNAPLLAAHDEQSYFDAKYRQHLPMQPGAPKFNAGVLLFNMPLLRAEGLLERTRQLASEHVYGMDQGALNVAFEGRWQTMHPFWNVMTNYSSQIPFSRCYARHFAWGKPWEPRPVGVEVDAMAVYRDLAKGTPWAGRFSRSWPVKRGLMKNFGRKFDAISGILLNDEKRKRRARFDAEKVSAIFADQADKSMLAVQYPERVTGIAR
ncbi:glycosyltransferase [Mesorhizobium sp. LSJC285A00]|uniref:glycosyltransferase family 8 protein n=1 Tax=Mesorhizobium sp. LSJC285A00 TaxID=1287338 RepID=UPI0012EC8515|nr:glycosyltransferase [Mesorhizobium sp. LSJC285A00]